MFTGQVQTCQRANVKTCKRSYRAEGVGFEPTVAFATTVFKTVAFNRSAIPPSGCDFTIKKRPRLAISIPDNIGIIRRL
jgi:hypothetical protein